MKAKYIIVRTSLLFIIPILYSFSVVVQAQKTKVSLKDSIDGAFDLSDYIINANGFVPLPYIITEPALGGFGGVLAPIFLKKRPPYIDSVRGERRVTPIPPDITGGAIGYTVNIHGWPLALDQALLERQE